MTGTRREEKVVIISGQGPVRPSAFAEQESKKMVQRRRKSKSRNGETTFSALWPFCRFYFLSSPAVKMKSEIIFSCLFLAGVAYDFNRASFLRGEASGTDYIFSLWWSSSPGLSLVKSCKPYFPFCEVLSTSTVPYG